MTCFFDPTHGYGTEQVMWTPPWGVARAIPVCGSCGHRVRVEQPGAAGHGQAYGHPGQHGAYAPPPPPPPPPAHGYPPAPGHGGHGYPPPPPPAHYPPPPAAHYPPPPPVHYGHHGHHGHHGRHGYRHRGHGYRHGGGVGVGGVVAAGAAGLVAGAVLEDMFDDDE